MKKRNIALLLSVLIAGGLVGCSNGISQRDYDEVVAENKQLQKENEELEQKAEEYLDLYARAKADLALANAGLDIPDNYSGEEGAENGALEKEVYSDEFVSISYLCCERDKNYGYSGEYNVVFVVENKTTSPLTIGMNSLAVDGWNLSDAFVHQEISANSKGKVEISTTELETLSPTKISGNLYIADESKTLWGSLMYDAIFTDINVE